ncbi:response regulator [Halpernia frigidisoli]|uniref:Response regulator receiver domain-containing protein n=1 Tax=Halpernia frigidisoli TaxID=1125876 RepID=A0A1I3IRN3_9FLAO|nr:response regulator [Halpernia frigidisoli]SFI50638.1 Response regulator receiver domain-containing protein [Halpernia frigidisoli]
MENLMQPAFNKVMIIDDNALDLYIAAKLITNNNFSKCVLEYNSASAALEFLAENQEKRDLLPQIIFVDIYMPLMDGFEFLENYKLLSPSLTDHCKIIMVSSTIDDRDIFMAKNDHSISLFAVKPITRSVFDNILSL